MSSLYSNSVRSTFVNKNLNRQKKGFFPARFAYPATEDLLFKATKCMESCHLHEQIMVTHTFFSTLVLRGVRQGVYKEVDFQRLTHILDYLQHKRGRELSQLLGGVIPQETPVSAAPHSMVS